MVQARLPPGAFVGNAGTKNPYAGKISKAIAYERYESKFILPDGPGLTHGMRLVARKLVEHLPAKKSQRILDAGSGTGIASLEIFRQHPDLKIVGIDVSPGMLAIARFKFHQTRWDRRPPKARQLLENERYEDAVTINNYWNDFRNESLPFQHQVEFVQGDFKRTARMVEIFGEETFNHAVANQFVHWTGIQEAFASFSELVMKGGSVVWNSASHFFNDSEYPAERFGFRYNDFVRYVMDHVAKFVEVKDYHSLSVPQYELKQVIEMTEARGFSTKQVGVYRLPVKLKFFVSNHVPVIVEQLVISNATRRELKAITEEAIAKAENTAAALRDYQHKYDIVPMFISKKN